MPRTPVEYAFFALVILVAGYVRGYGGFGFSMITVAGLTLLFPPAAVVPAVLLLEIVASTYLIIGVWREVDWRALMWLTAGVIAGTPLGVWLLGVLPEHLLKISIAVVVAILAGLLRSGFRPRHSPGTGGTMATGAISGIFNGSAAVGGPPVVLFFFSSPGSAAISRASLIAYFLGTDIIAVGTCAGMGVLAGGHLRLFLLALIPMGVGLAVGKRSFFKTDQELFRKRVMSYLIVLSGLLLVKTLWGMYQA
jgi:uncharacterized membrane protein YfcA